jgi:hypothetical protein
MAHPDTTAWSHYYVWGSGSSSQCASGRAFTYNDFLYFTSRTDTAIDGNSSCGSSLTAPQSFFQARANMFYKPSDSDPWTVCDNNPAWNHPSASNQVHGIYDQENRNCGNGYYANIAEHQVAIAFAWRSGTTGNVHCRPYSLCHPS